MSKGKKEKRREMGERETEIYLSVLHMVLQPPDSLSGRPSDPSSSHTAHFYYTRTRTRTQVETFNTLNLSHYLGDLAILTRLF